ncbi:hypothetical protein DFAR_200042 [Desulfarculales bacterium]
MRVQACGICTLKKRIFSGALNLGLFYRGRPQAVAPTREVFMMP